VSRIKRIFGLDGVDLMIHFGVTFFLMVLAESATQNEVGIAFVGAASLVLLGVRRQIALKRMPVETTGEVALERMADLDARFGEVDMLHVRIQELEERLDFAERLLAQARTEPARLEAPR
jgi:hypothetical protein